ncbi:ComEC/Rec2 family competence protein [Novosphingobium cyanobacteriorum]|uniref:ComEC/Rec2 family competence protein n=1 Tax=Novosphingobium cyanobacteriorum TaxID=3024215 RepID=A0ABT6CP45_9SPHN|nr:ComEC/Rec2 family competence protein [Novosphingobium cyanobacteriorum]MDF8334082.1 ComEC/Rec2 family competence protein [Novosphingobium cyanobacteriorum]
MAHEAPVAQDAPASGSPPGVPAGRSARPWDSLRRLARVHCTIEQFLANRPFERGPWLAVAFGLGIAAWFVLPGPWQWAMFLALCGAAAIAGVLVDQTGELDRDLGHLRLAILSTALMAAAGCVTVWAKSSLVGVPGIARPQVAWLEGRVIDRQDEAADNRVRLVLVARVEGAEAPMRLRVNVPLADDAPGAVEGAVVRMRARLMPPAPPMLPGGYDFARAAWFQGLSATGAALGPVQVATPAQGAGSLRAVQQALADHVRARLSGSPGAIAAALASGDRGAIAQADEDAMRDAGLTHLLSISGLHVSAVIAAVYFIALRLLGLFPWIVLRLRLPLVAALAGALAGVAYTLVTGAEVPTVRSVVGALLVLTALALGRDPLSLRLLAVAAVFVMLLWPEAVVGPSFQMSFASVIAIIAFHASAPAQRWFARRDEGWLAGAGRHLAMLLATGVVIELALTPIALFHFHRAGLYGAAANVVAIPLTTFGTMPLIALALLLDGAGLGAPAWWLAGKSLDLLLALAHFTAGLPGAVTMMPTMSFAVFGLFLGGLLWLALWSGRVRLWALAPFALATLATLLARAPDVLISGDGHHVGIANEAPNLLMLRDAKADFARDNLLESAGMRGEAVTLESWPGARCNRDFCSLMLTRNGRAFVLLMARGKDRIDTLELAAACERADIVVADRRLPMACRPRLLKADRALLDRTGGMTLDLTTGKIRTVAETQGNHGWFRIPERPVYPPRPAVTP